MQRFEVVRVPNTNVERRKLIRFNRWARENACKTLDTMQTYDTYNEQRIDAENQSHYLAWKNKRLEQEPKYKDIINALGYVPTIDRQDVLQE